MRNPEQAELAAPYDPRRNLTAARTGTGRDLHVVADGAGLSNASAGAILMGTDIAPKIHDIGTWDRAQCLKAWVDVAGVAPGSRLSA